MSSSFSPTPAELTLVSQLFFKGDPQNHGFIPTDVAVRLASGAKISPIIIGEIFNIADETKTGKLSKKDISAAVRLIGWAQKGEKITRTLLGTRKS
jgi:epidermal growth factor receptor substrate 15